MKSNPNHLSRGFPSLLAIVATAGCMEMSDDPELDTAYAFGLAATATASASTAYDSRGQGASKAIDGFVGGYPTAPTQEWVSVRQLAGAWLQLSWPSAVSMSSVVLHDRVNPYDRIMAATLRFSDGSTVPVSGPKEGERFSNTTTS